MLDRFVVICLSHDPPIQVGDSWMRDGDAVAVIRVRSELGGPVADHARCDLVVARAAPVRHHVRPHLTEVTCPGVMPECNEHDATTLPLAANLWILGCWTPERMAHFRRLRFASVR